MKHPPNAAHPPHAAPEKKKALKSAKKDKATAEPAPMTRDPAREEAIRQTAYFLYLSRNGENGHELEDWLQAEAQLASMPMQDAGGREPATQSA